MDLVSQLVELAWWLPLGIVAGALSTVSGLGGGILLVLTLSLTEGPLRALAITTPALLLSNAHRLLVFRRNVSRDLIVPIGVGAFVGSITGGIVAARLPALALHILLLATSMFGIARARGWITLQPPRTALAPAAFVVGGLAATSGGAGLLMSPLLLSQGLHGDPYVATLAAAAVAMHVGRVTSYGATGLLDASTLSSAAVLVVALFLGNWVGVRIRARLDERQKRNVELCTLAMCVVLAVCGLAR